MGHGRVVRKRRCENPVGRRSKHKKNSPPVNPSIPDKDRSSRSATPRSAPIPPGRMGGWYAANRRDLRFLLIFCSCMVLYFCLTLTSFIKDGFFPRYLRLNASVSGVVLNLMGQDVHIDQQAIISSGGSSINVERGCDAVAPSALFVSAVLASPVALGSRLLAATVGMVLLVLLNLVRVISLFLVRVHWPEAFDIMHLDVWQALFIFVAILMWALWASRAARTVQDRAEHGAALA